MEESEEATKGGEQSPWGFLLGVFLISRLFYLLAGALLVGIVQLDPFQRETFDVPFGTLNIWAHYDGEHYANIAKNGYYSTVYGESPAFFPLYPVLIRFVAGFFGGPVSLGGLSVWGVLISLAALPFAFYFIYQIAEEGWGERAAKGTVLTLAFFPTAFFLNSVYTESLFLMLSAGALWAVRVQRDFYLGCLFVAFATATRNVGVLLLVPLIYEWWRNRQEFGWQAMALALAPSGLFVYMVWLWRQFGDPLLFLNEQAKWQRNLDNPLGTVRDAFGLAGEDLRSLFDPKTYEPFGLEGLLYAFGGVANLYNLLFFALAYVVLAVGVRWLPTSLTLYALALILVPVFFGSASSPLLSMPRFVLVAFPLFIVLGIVLTDRRFLAVWVTVSAAISLAFCALFVNWYFVA